MDENTALLLNKCGGVLGSQSMALSGLLGEFVSMHGYGFAWKPWIAMATALLLALKSHCWFLERRSLKEPVVLVLE